MVARHDTTYWERRPGKPIACRSYLLVRHAQLCTTLLVTNLASCNAHRPLMTVNLKIRSGPTGPGYSITGQAPGVQTTAALGVDPTPAMTDYMHLHRKLTVAISTKLLGSDLQ